MASEARHLGMCIQNPYRVFCIYNPLACYLFRRIFLKKCESRKAGRTIFPFDANLENLIWSVQRQEQIKKIKTGAKHKTKKEEIPLLSSDEI